MVTVKYLSIFGSIETKTFETRDLADTFIRNHNREIKCVISIDSEGSAALSRIFG